MTSSGGGSRISQCWVIIVMTGSPFVVTPHSPVGTANDKPVPSPAAVLAPVPLLNYCVTAGGVPRNGELSAFLACLSDVIAPRKIIKFAQESARVAKVCIGIMGHMVVTQMALVEIGGGRVDGLDCNQGCLLRNGVEMAVARLHGLADGGSAGHFWWRK